MQPGDGNACCAYLAWAWYGPALRHGSCITLPLPVAVVNMGALSTPPQFSPLQDVAYVSRCVAEANVYALAAHQYWGTWSLLQVCYGGGSRRVVLMVLAMAACVLAVLAVAASGDPGGCSSRCPMLAVMAVLAGASMNCTLLC